MIIITMILKIIDAIYIIDDTYIFIFLNKSIYNFDNFF